MVLKIEKLINSLDLVYYKYDKETKVLAHSQTYLDKSVEAEFFKITYHLCGEELDFKVLKDKSIQFGKRGLSIKERIKSLLK